MASKRPHPTGWLLRWREPSAADPGRRLQRSWVCAEAEARAEVYREEAEQAERAGGPGCPPDRRPGPGRAGVDAEVAALLAEHGLRGVAVHYLRELRTIREKRPDTVEEVRSTLRRFLRWVSADLGEHRGSRVDPQQLSMAMLGRWWTWMLSADRVVVARVKRGAVEYDRTYIGPLARSSAYKDWTTVVAFWRWAAQVEEFHGAVPTCPTERLRKPYRDSSKEVAARRPVVAASWEQAAGCVAQVPDWVRPLIILCYYTGLRVGQARELTWDDVHLDGHFAHRHGGPLLWVGQGKTPAEGDGRFLPVHPALAAWLRERRSTVSGLDALPGDLRRTGTAAYRARVAGLAEGRIAWEVGDQNVALQLRRAWVAAGVPGAVWEKRTAHAFRKALRTNVVNASTEPGARTWQAAERLIGHALPGELDTYQSDSVLMPTMRRLVESIPRWEEAACTGAAQVIPFPAPDASGDLEALG